MYKEIIEYESVSKKGKKFIQRRTIVRYDEEDLKREREERARERFLENERRKRYAEYDAECAWNRTSMKNILESYDEFRKSLEF